MATFAEVLNVELAEIGYKESPSGSNKTKYGVAYGWDGVPWCVIFQWWCFNQANASDLFLNGGKAAACSLVMNYAKSIGRWVTDDYQPGDLVIFDFNHNGDPDHIGFLYIANGNNTYYVIEGNTSVTSNDNGGSVMKRYRYKSQIMGAYRPAYDVDTSSTAQDTTQATTGGFDVSTLATIKYGSQGSQARAMQCLLVGLGYSCGRSTTPSLSQVDGSIGAYSIKALKKFQTDRSLYVDGICGKQTWTALLGATS